MGIGSRDATSFGPGSYPGLELSFKVKDWGAPSQILWFSLRFWAAVKIPTLEPVSQNPEPGLQSLMLTNTLLSELVTEGSLLHEQPMSSFKLQENRIASGELLRFKDYLQFFLQDKRFMCYQYCFP